MRIEIPFLSGRVGDARGQAGDQGELIVDQFHGKYYQAAKLGRMFSTSTTPLGLALPIYTGTTIVTAAICGLPLWNPPGSGVKAVLVGFKAARASGTAAYGAFGLMARNNMGASALTAAPWAAFAETVPINGNGGVINGVGGTGGGGVSRVRTSNAGTTTLTTGGAAAEWVETLSATEAEADVTANGISYVDVDFDGRWEVFPGTAIWFAAGRATVALYATTLTWIEEPI